MLEDITGEQIKEQFKSNKNVRMTTYIVGGIVVLVLGYFAYLQWVWNPANEKSMDSYWSGLNLAAADSTELALDELGAVKNKYDGKVGGEIAQFVYARQLMSNGDYKAAIDELEGVNVSDTYVSVMKVGLIGDCYSEMEDYKTAAEMYIQAADMSDNEMTTPIYLFKGGLCAEEINDFETAVDCYTKIEDNYLSFATQKQIKKYIARASSKTVE